MLVAYESLMDYLRSLILVKLKNIKYSWRIAKHEEKGRHENIKHARKKSLICLANQLYNQFLGIEITSSDVSHVGKVPRTRWEAVVFSAGLKAMLIKHFSGAARNCWIHILSGRTPINEPILSLRIPQVAQ